MVIRLGPFAESETVIETGACSVDHGGKRGIVVVDVRLQIVQFN
jgi:hypothetical protein